MYSAALKSKRRACIEKQEQIQVVNEKRGFIFTGLGLCFQHAYFIPIVGVGNDRRT